MKSLRLVWLMILLVLPTLFSSGQKKFLSESKKEVVSIPLDDFKELTIAADVGENIARQNIWLKSEIAKKDQDIIKRDRLISSLKGVIDKLETKAKILLVWSTVLGIAIVLIFYLKRREDRRRVPYML